MTWVTYVATFLGRRVLKRLSVFGGPIPLTIYLAYKIGGALSRLLRLICTSEVFFGMEIFLAPCLDKENYTTNLTQAVSCFSKHY